MRPPAPWCCAAARFSQATSAQTMCWGASRRRRIKAKYIGASWEARLFGPAERIETRVFARLPETLRIKGRKSAWAFGKGSDNLHSFLEGPCFDRAGNLFVTDIPYGRILRVTPDGTWSVVTEYDGWPNGLAIHRDGRIFIADHKRGIMVLDVASGRVDPVLEGVRREGFKGTNDLTFARNGDLYFTDQGQ